jgi:hypothetical protein
MTGIEEAAVIQLDRPQVPVHMAVECPLLGRLSSHCRPLADVYGNAAALNLPLNGEEGDADEMAHVPSMKSVVLNLSK